MNYAQQNLNTQQGVYPPQYPYPMQSAYGQQPAYAPQDPYAQQNPYAQQQPCPPQNPYAQQPAYAPQNPYAQQQPYVPQNFYAPQYNYDSYAPQPAAPDPLNGGNQFAAWAAPGFDWASFDLEEMPEAQLLPMQEEPFAGQEESEAHEQKPDTPAKRALRFASNAVFWLVCVALVAGSVLFALNKDPNKSYFNTGYRTYNVLTNSMRPKADGSSPPGGFVKGDTILVKMCKPEEVVAGDIITFNPNPNNPEAEAYLTHRVMDVLHELGGKEGIFFVTKGDANNSEDPPIAGASVIGKKVATVPKVGGVLLLVRQHFVVCILIIVGLMGSILMFQWYFAKPKEEELIEKPEKATKDKDTVRLSGKRRFV